MTENVFTVERFEINGNHISHEDESLLRTTILTELVNQTNHLLDVVEKMNVDLKVAMFQVSPQNDQTIDVAALVGKLVSSNPEISIWEYVSVLIQGSDSVPVYQTKFALRTSGDIIETYMHVSVRLQKV